MKNGQLICTTTTTILRLPMIMIEYNHVKSYVASDSFEQQVCNISMQSVYDGIYLNYKIERQKQNDIMSIIHSKPTCRNIQWRFNSCSMYNNHTASCHIILKLCQLLAYLGISMNDRHENKAYFTGQCYYDKRGDLCIPYKIPVSLTPMHL